MSKSVRAMIDALRVGVIAATVLTASVTMAAAQTPQTYNLQSIGAALTPDIAHRTIAGKQRIILNVTSPTLTTLHFDANALTVRSVLANGEAATYARVEDGHLITFREPFEAGDTIFLDIVYDGPPGPGLTIADDHLYTSYFTCSWMLCTLDRPGDKARFWVRLTLPEGWTSFASDVEPYSPHLFGFAAGKVSTIRQQAAGTEIVTASPTLGEADLRALFAEAPAMFAFFREKAGMPFPHGTYWQFVPPGGGAQEGAGFAILGVDALKTVRDTPPDDWAIAHEMAHTYWGNLVTSKDWTHFWLNEGLTVFMTAAWKQHRWGEASYAQEIERASARWNGAKERGWDRPLAFSGAYPDLRTRRAIQYSKGMLFFVELRRTLGEEAFWRGVYFYTRAHYGGTVQSVDLQRAFERASGKDLHALFAEWVYE